MKPTCFVCKDKPAKYPHYKPTICSYACAMEYACVDLVENHCVEWCDKCDSWPTRDCKHRPETDIMKASRPGTPK